MKSDIIPYTKSLIPTNQIKSEFIMIFFKFNNKYYKLEHMANVNILNSYYKYFASEFFSRINHTNIEENEMITFLTSKKIPNILKLKIEDITEKSINRKYIKRLEEKIKSKEKKLLMLKKRRVHLSSLSNTSKFKLQSINEKISLEKSYIYDKIRFIEFIKNCNVVLITCKTSLISFLEQKHDLHTKEVLKYIQLFKMLTEKNGQDFDKYMDRWTKELMTEVEEGKIDNFLK